PCAANVTDAPFVIGRVADALGAAVDQEFPGVSLCAVAAPHRLALACGDGGHGMGVLSVGAQDEATAREGGRRFVEWLFAGSALGDWVQAGYDATGGRLYFRGAERGRLVAYDEPRGQAPPWRTISRKPSEW